MAGAWYYLGKKTSSSPVGGTTPRTPSGGTTPQPSSRGTTPQPSSGGTPGCTPAGTASTSGLGNDCCYKPTDGSDSVDISGICLSAPAAGPAPGGTPGAPVNCSGYWVCSAQCNDGTNTAMANYVVGTPASNGGEPCKDTDGTILTSESTKPCYSSLPPCGVNCVGDWVKNANTDSDGWAPCSSPCGYGTQTRTYSITRQQQAGGAACPYLNGETVSRPCPNLPQCAQNTDCVGDWGGWSGCSKGCGGGTKTRTYYVTTPKSGSGQACPHAHGDVDTQPCNTTPTTRNKITRSFILQ